MTLLAINDTSTSTQIKLVFTDSKALTGDKVACETLLPRQKTSGASGYDLVAANTNDICLKPGHCQKIPTGISLEIPVGVEAQIRPRSGLAFQYQVTCLNSPGTIDADYRGEIAVLLINHGHEDFIVSRGMRIAQMVFAQIIPTHLSLTSSLSESTRGNKGFGSTGI